MSVNTFLDRLAGALYGQAIGDAMGGPVEGWPPDRILEQFEGHDFTTFLPPTHVGDPSPGKGDGRVTDDTLMAEALIFAYRDSQDHLDAYGYAEYLIPHVRGIPVWVPERGREMDLWDVRIVKRNLRKGLLSLKEYQKYLKKLQDVGDKSVPLSEPQPLEPRSEDEDEDEDA